MSWCICWLGEDWEYLHALMTEETEGSSMTPEERNPTAPTHTHEREIDHTH